MTAIFPTVCRTLCAALTAAVLTTAAATAKTVPEPPPFAAWLDELKSEAMRRGIRAATLDAALGDAQPI
ncbi:MAG: hypothetical protein VW405_10115, partial [Rhodospirillaceae bacterium]